MAQELRFGVAALQFVPWPALLEQWQQIEALGFDSLWLGDHFAVPHLETTPVFDSWTTLAALATRIPRIRVGIGVTNVALRHPAILAKQAITVDHVSGGRLELGLGAGYYEREHQWLGIPFLTAPQRVARFREAVQIVDRMLRDEVTTHQGRYYQVMEAPVYPRAVQRPRPPLTLAANGPTSLRLTAEYADSWNSLGGPGFSPRESVEVTRQRNELLDEYCAAIGRDPNEITRSFLVGFANDTPFASLDAFHEVVGRYREIGIDEFIFYGVGDEGREWAASRGLLGRWGDRAMLERVATEAIPKLRQKVASTGGKEQQ
jgi:alkanesulfonate monooxygenase SsuD/methylene tetrahydromethanopterin reductase-like flavin-dependent oxidoreductase (luciferase family)